MTSDKFSYTVSIHYDRRLYKQDIAGSVAHARMLAKQGIITGKDRDYIVTGLAEIKDEIETDSFPWRRDLEDIHMNIENRLREKIGDAAGKLHTARSRNDQVATDMRLYVKEAIDCVLSEIIGFRKTLLDQAKSHSAVVMPGYTHLQRAQPVYFAHHLLAYFEMLGRDAERFIQARNRADVMPLGSGALAGVPYPIDREWVAKELGFGSISDNSMDAVSDRDFLLDFHAAAATCAVHMSRMGEELVLWSSEEFGFVRLSDEYTTGSSMMPQKRNPDFAELARGKTGRVVGNLVSLIMVLKGLPLTYNRDLQEDKESFFDTLDNLLGTLCVMNGMYASLQLSLPNLRNAAEASHVLATDIADYLVEKGIPFRDAHGLSSRISDYAAESGKALSDLALDEYLSFSDYFTEDVLEITVDSSIESRTVLGGTASVSVKHAIEKAEQSLKEENND